MIDIIQHHFIGGGEHESEVYLKEMRIADGFEVVSHKHLFDHISLLTRGSVIVEADGIKTVHYAPDYIFIKKGINHSVTPVNSDAKWYCVHITDESDETKVDDVLIQEMPSYVNVSDYQTTTEKDIGSVFFPCSHENMVKADFKFDVSELVDQIEANPSLWDRYTMRTALLENSPHREVSDIWLRYRDWSEFDIDNPQSFSDEHISQFYAAYYELPAVQNIIAEVMRQMPEGTELGGALITRINPGCEVKPHEDHGWHAEYYRDKFLVLLQSDHDQSFNFDGESHTGLAGDVFEFKNQAKHWVINSSNTPRISLIFACRKP
ncbi:MAG: aspartyl/asparaginyl beta-hydroxylase domain-containing protein [Methylococcaceae bacterium]|jgi:quercetin dioxygenase-like cupin family protein